jgi:hypothetical protein
MNAQTIRVKPWGEGQGDHVVISAEDFDPAIHTPLDAADKPADAPKALTVAELRAALADKGIEIPEGAKKADLQALLDAADKPAE